MVGFEFSSSCSEGATFLSRCMFRAGGSEESKGGLGALEPGGSPSSAITASGSKEAGSGSGPVRSAAFSAAS